MASIKGILEALEQQKIAVADAGKIAAHAAAQWEEERKRLVELERQARGEYYGSSDFTTEERVEARRGILSVLSRPMCLSELSEALPRVDRLLLENEVGYLRNRQVIQWNGGRGLASKYSRK